MGKTSFRSRRGGTVRPSKKSAPAATTTQNADPVEITEAELTDVDHSEMNHNFENYEQAIQACIDDGWEYARFCPNFTSTAVVTRLNALIESNVTIIDKTVSIPGGCEGNYSMIPLTQYLLRNISETDHTRAFFVMRNQSNTPAFLCGTMAGLIACHSGDKNAARATVQSEDTPAGFLIYKGERTVIPTLVVQGTETIAANMLAACIDNDPQKFCCNGCNETVMKRHGSVWGTTGFVAYACDHCFHPWCIQSHFQDVAHSCPICHAQAQPEDKVAHSSPTVEPES